MAHRHFVLIARAIVLMVIIVQHYAPTRSGSGEASDEYKVFLPLIYRSADVYYAAPNGSSGGTGAIDRPWDLQTALNQPAALQPGATLWLRGGRYSGAFISRLKGQADKPITVRPYPGERATLDGTGKVLTIGDTYYVNFWDLEITNSQNRRTITNQPGGNDGVFVDQSKPSHHIKLINLVIHDLAGIGAALWASTTDSEIYGSLIYFNGVNELDHGIYTQNHTGAKRIINNFIFDNASHGIHAYSSSAARIDYYTVQGNTVFNNGSIGYDTGDARYGSYTRNILVGGSSVAQNPVIDSNYAYYPSNAGTNLNLGFSAGTNNARVTNNYFVLSKLIFAGPQTGIAITNNTVYSTTISGILTSAYPENLWSSSRPGGLQIFMRANQYEPRRANLTIFNWDRAASVSVSAAQMAGLQIRAGDRYELHNVQNYYGDVIGGTYNGASISVPMTGRSVAQPTGLGFKPASTFPELGAFVLIVLGP